MADLLTEPALAKRALREKLRFRRRHFAANLEGVARIAAFRIMPEPLAQLIEDRSVIGAYAASGGEPDVLPLLGEAASIALPHHRDRSPYMEFRVWKRGDPLEKGPWGTSQPVDGADSVLPGLIFCPLLGFDRKGGRLGQGGGHYDRYFAMHPESLRIGIGWAIQEIDQLPSESTDVALDAVLTEQEFIVFGDRL